MSTVYTVQQGDHLSKIAMNFGFSDYRVIWDHPDNAALKAKRKNPNVLFPGDTLFIPDRELREESCSTDQRHRFTVRTTVPKLRLVLEDLYETPIANANCMLVVGNDVRNVTTDGSGRIEQVLPPGEDNAYLIIQDDSQTAFNFVEIPLKIGHLDPVEELTGQQARLKNLGYFFGEIGDKEDESFRAAVEEFQCDNSLTVDGICGPKTQAKLKAVHGC